MSGAPLQSVTLEAVSCSLAACMLTKAALGTPVFVSISMIYNVRSEVSLLKAEAIALRPRTHLLA